MFLALIAVQLRDNQTQIWQQNMWFQTKKIVF